MRTAADEARKIELRKQASDPNIQALLAPFITPDYAQIDGVSVDKLPHSFTKLKTSEALSHTVLGMSRLVEVAISKNGRVRPRWDMNREFWMKSEDNIEKVKKVQDLLSELGPVLVEMGLLQP